jgi:hypothetical protein
MDGADVPVAANTGGGPCGIEVGGPH